MPMTDEEYAEFHNRKYQELPAEFKAEAIKLLKQTLTSQTQDEIRMLHTTHGAPWIHEIPMGHFGFGMGIRNLLRKNGLTDDKAGGNLDDYYVQLLEASCGCRPE